MNSSLSQHQPKHQRPKQSKQQNYHHMSVVIGPPQSIPAALDKDVDEELLLDIPPPPPLSMKRHPISPMHHSSALSSSGSSIVDGASKTVPSPRSSSRSKPRLPPSNTVAKQQPKQTTVPKKKKTSSSSSTSSTKKNKISRIDSFHNAILTNISETEQLRKQQNIGSVRIQQQYSHGSETNLHQKTDSVIPDINTTSSLITETIRDISTAAQSTMETLKLALEQTQHAKHKPRQSKNRENVPSPACVPPVVTVSYVPVSETKEEEGDANHNYNSAVTANNTTSPVELTQLLSKWCGIQPQSQHASSISTSKKGSGTKTPNSDANHSSSSWEPHVKKMQDAVSKVVGSVQHHTANHSQDIWRTSGNDSNNYNNSNSHTAAAGTSSRRYEFAGDTDEHDQHNHHNNDNNNSMLSPSNWANLLGIGSPDDDEEEDQQTIGTFDTLQEENSQLRRLGSWGTIASNYTAGTGGTFNEYYISSTMNDDGSSPATSSEEGADALRLLREDDYGHVIDPVLLEKTQKLKQQRQKQQQSQASSHRKGSADAVAGSRGSRAVHHKKRRTKVVQFDYPPIKSLRQYIRPDPEDLPNLFFTEQELDQIEEDRYCTMSTDDIEIVAVSSKLTSSGEEENNDDVDDDDDDEEDDDDDDNNNVNHPHGAPVTPSSSKQRQRGLAASEAVPEDRNDDEPRESSFLGCGVGDRNDNYSITTPLLSPTKAGSSSNNNNNASFKSVRGRHGTPHRRRPNSNNNTAASNNNSMSSSEQEVVVNSKKKGSAGISSSTSLSSTRKNNSSSNHHTTTKSPRLVKGVQIYLRERSTGA